LKHAREDATNTLGIGFDTVARRGEFAFNYLNKTHPLAAGEEETACIANSLFTQSNLGAAWLWATANWNEQNLIALVHLWFGDVGLEWGPYQRDSFDTWKAGNDEEAKAFFDKHLVKKDFTADPWKGALTPIQYPGPLKDLQPPLTSLTPLPPWQTTVPLVETAVDQVQADKLTEAQTIALKITDPSVFLNPETYAPPPYHNLQWAALWGAIAGLGLSGGKVMQIPPNYPYRVSGLLGGDVLTSSMDWLSTEFQAGGILFNIWDKLTPADQNFITKNW
jgi:hypothetical protein